MKVNYSSAVVVCLLVIICSTTGISQKENDGWEDGSKFNSLFNTKTIDTVFGEIVSLDSVKPTKGMSYGIQLIVKTKKDTVTAVLCPTWFTKCLNICLKANDKIEIEGSRVTLNNKPIMIAARIICNGIILKMRNDKGHPIWDYLRPG
jgi:hypothetical protein